jgi:hypothetical protein
LSASGDFSFAVHGGDCAPRRPVNISTPRLAVVRVIIHFL